MMMRIAVFCLCVLAVSCVDILRGPEYDWLPKADCNTNSDCKANQCCVSRSDFLIVSKRESGPIKTPLDFKIGVCTDYIAEGESCHYMGWAGCGCQPGTTCIHHPPPEPPKPTAAIDMLSGRLFQKRMVLPKPGDSFCELEE